MRRFSHVTDEVTRRHGLTTRRYELLVMIEGAPDGSHSATVSSLTERMHLAQHSVTELVARAEEAGLISRTIDQIDRRISHITLTGEGRRRLDATAEALEPERATVTTLLADAYRRARELSRTPK